MRWIIPTLCVLCLSLVVITRGLQKGEEKVSADRPEVKETKETAETLQEVDVAQSSQSRSLREVPLAHSTTDEKRAKRLLEPQQVSKQRFSKHNHDYGFDHDCAECQAFASIMDQPVSLAVENLPAENSDEYVTSLLGKISGVTVGHACAESGRLDLVFASGLTDVITIRQALSDSGINILGSIFNMKVEGTITENNVQLINQELENMDGVTLLNISEDSGNLEFLITNSTPNRNEITRALRRSGYKVVNRRRR